jgi:hypothetical protein
MSIKNQTAELLAQSGEEVILPQAADFRGFLRDAVCTAIDQTVEEHGAGKLLDKDLPELFRCLDALAEKLFLRGMGLAD